MKQTKATSCRSYQGGYFKTLIAPELTANTLSLLELTLPKGAEPPPHIHTHEDEFFYVLHGEISVTIEDTVILLEKGNYVFAPRKVAHSFKILTESATFLNLITPGRLWNYFMQFSEPLSQLPETVAVPSTPPPGSLQAMVDVISNVYQVNFLKSLK